ncbi:hypothetical protein KKG66_12080, partial [bacterium]|nr:hypothetical protein [bacterium]
MAMLTLLMFALANLAIGTPRCSHLEKIQACESLRETRLTALDADSSHSYNQTALLLDYRVENSANVPLTGRALVTLTANEMLTWIPFNAEGLAIYGISEMGNDLDFIYRNDTLWVEKTLYPGQSATIEIQLT